MVRCHCVRRAVCQAARPASFGRRQRLDDEALDKEKKEILEREPSKANPPNLVPGRRSRARQTAAHGAFLWRDDPLRLEHHEVGRS